MKTIEIDQDVYNYVISNATQAGESPSSILRRELHLPQPKENIEVDDETYDYLLAKMTNFGESASDVLRRELNIDDAHPHDPTNTIIFHIPSGTGNQPWNRPESAIVAIVGSVLRIVNDDMMPHRLHTSGVPFPHPNSDILPGQAADFILQVPFDPSTSQPLYDHAAGPTAQFWIRVQQP